jgi:antitoxin component of MazEF toxin-antitoxin module
VQIPRDVLSQLGIEGNKVRLEVLDDQIVISKPAEEEPKKEA